MALSIPLDVQDGAYPASLDRLRFKCGGMQAGVVEENDFKVTAGAGLQVNVASGHSYIKQTLAKLGEFYNGLYFVANDASTNPSNNAVVSSVYPQLAQIILRVYDVTELGISGSSYARLEWLNGTPTEGATKENRKGAAELPQSSIRIADVLVPKNCVSSAEFEIVDRRTWAEGGQECAAYPGRAGGVITSSMLREDAVGASDKIANEVVTGAKLGLETLRQETGEARAVVIYGRIGAAGEVDFGAGFTAKRTATGEYTITFTTPFTTSPAVVMSVDLSGSGEVLSSPGLQALDSTTSIGVKIWNYKEELANSAFSFVAIGPR